MLAILMNSLRLKHKKRRKSELAITSLDCCRTCLGTEDLRPIFRGLDVEDKRSTEIQLLTGLEVKNNDGLPQNLCKTCDTIIHEAMKFRRMSQKTYKTLFNTVSKVKRKNIPKLKLEKEENGTLDGLSEYSNHNKLTIDKVYVPVVENGINSIENIPVDDFFKTETKLIDQPVNNQEFNNDFEAYEDFFTDEYVGTDAKKTVKIAKKRKVKKEPTHYKCNVCHKEFTMKNTYRAHMRFHNNYCVCELCGKKCRNNNLLLLHKRGKHGAERIHKCGYCEYAAANKEGLVIHERRHTGEKPYVCDHCGASFHRRSNLVQHIAIHLPDKKFQCTFCPKRLKSRKLLQIHVHGAHTGPRYAYLCPLCARRFNKPNKCNICNKKFQSKKFLGSHKFKQHQEKRYTYVCQICKNQFRTTDSTRKHMLRAHGVSRAQQGPVYRIPNVHKKLS